MSFTEALATWCAETPRVDGERALALARDAVVDTVGDTVGCMLVGSRDDTTARVLRAARSFGGGDATVAGYRERLSMSSAALVNGTAAHVYDFDDNFHPAAAHASAVLVPAILAVAEAQDCGGQDLLDAYVIGLEAMGRIGEAVNMDHYERGWHATSTLGPLGAAAACARLLGLDSQHLGWAISLASSMAGGSKVQLGAMAKPVHAGIAAQHGVIAALLAREGVTGAAEPLDGPWGFRDLFAGDASPGFGGLEARLGRPLAIETYGLMTKPHPCCASVHCTADGVIALMREHGLQAGDIARVDTHVPQVTVDHLRYPLPRDEREARFSMQYGVAVVIVQGHMKLVDFRADAIGRSAIAEWSDRIHMHASDSVREFPLQPNVLEPAEVHLRLADGRTVTKLVKYAKGALQNPMSASERREKFRDCTEGLLEPCTLAELESMLARLHELSSVRELTSVLGG